MTTELFTERKIAIMQLHQGKTVAEVAHSLNRSPGWVSKWHQRFREKGWPGLQERSRAPRKQGKQLSPAVCQAIFEARLELEAEAALKTGLRYIGGRAIRTRLKREQVSPLPSIASIERVLRQKKLTRTKKTTVQTTITYPHLYPTEPHQLCQVDILPKYLLGGQRVACFNALDVVSRYPTGQARSQRRSQDAVAFLLHIWQELGIADYTQVDNEGCFSGGATHPYVLGKVVRLALAGGTELVFSPVHHPQSNGYVERFHQDYDLHVWQDTYLMDLTAVQKQGEQFFQQYRQRQDHKALNGQTPHERHHQSPSRPLTASTVLFTDKHPLYEGCVHFIRCVTETGIVRVLNVDWQLLDFDPSKGVWVTLQLHTKGAILSVFDAAPDVQHRVCLATYPFPLQEAVLPRSTNEPVWAAPLRKCASHECAATALSAATPIKAVVASRSNRQCCSSPTAFVWE